MSRGNWIVGVALLAGLAVSAGAEQRAARGDDRPPDVSAAAERPTSTVAARATTGTILGTTRDAGSRLLPDTRVQVRSVRSGNLEQFTITDSAGAFAFRQLAAGTYVVEMTLSNGSIVAISDALALGEGDVIETIVQMAARSRSFVWWLGSTTTVALAQAASLGVLAVDGGQPVTPQ